MYGMSPLGLCVWTLGSQLIVPSWKVVGPLWREQANGNGPWSILAQTYFLSADCEWLIQYDQLPLNPDAASSARMDCTHPELLLKGDLWALRRKALRMYPRCWMFQTFTSVSDERREINRGKGQILMGTSLLWESWQTSLMRWHLSKGLAKGGCSLDRVPVVRTDNHVQQNPTQNRSRERGSGQMILDRLLSSSIIMVGLAIFFPIFSFFYLSCLSATQHTGI